MRWTSIRHRSVIAAVVIATCALGGCGGLERDLRRGVEDIEIKGHGSKGAPPKQSAGAKAGTPNVAAPPTGQWVPRVPKNDQYDWVKLKSGEWLKGEFKVLRNESVDFESKELDSLSLDWDDIHEARLAKSANCIFDGRRTTLGNVFVQKDVVHVRGADGVTRRYPRKMLDAIVPSRTTELGHWDGRLSFGLASRSGNVDQFNVTGSLDAVRRTDFTRLHVAYAGDYGELEGEKSSSGHRATGTFDIFLHRRLHVTPVGLEFDRDPFKNIKIRFTPYAALGVKAVDVADLEVEVYGGAGYRRTRFQSVEAGEDSLEEETVGLAGVTVDADLTKKVDLKLSYSLNVPFGNSAANVQHGEARLEIDLIGELDLDVGFTWDRQGRPERDDAGDRPEKTDTRVTVGLAYKF